MKEYFVLKGIKEAKESGRGKLGHFLLILFVYGKTETQFEFDSCVQHSLAM